ncbi:hypothetical protein KKE06_01395 [Candidatus Micrarchaeota archaeon]|nr:hypothetical protein [Candidatus Micrarchaeota archaeon]MBU1930412.1 hypothetical protein [Candidatus Micrarchaeota archaeon]
MLIRKLLLISAFLLLASIAFAQEIEVERNISTAIEPDDTIEIQINVSLNGLEPSSLIVTEEIPTGWTVVSSNPTAKDFDGKIKWLLFGSSLTNSITLRYTLQSPASFSQSQKISGDWRTLANGSGPTLGHLTILEAQEPPPAAPVCGDGTCDTGETQANCPADCGTAPPVQPPTDYTLYIGIIVIIVIILAVVLLLRKKKSPPTPAPQTAPRTSPQAPLQPAPQ